MKRIVFVGIHNKPKKVPLSSSTYSGKIIDAIIKEAGITNFRKTNLYDCDYLPFGDEAEEMERDYFDRVQATTDDVFILLGQTVRLNFPDAGFRTIKVAHPSNKRGKEQIADYVKNVSKILKKEITDGKQV